MLDLRAVPRPTSPEEAVKLFAEAEGNGLYVAGGTIIVPAGSSRLDFLIDLSRAGLNYIRMPDEGPRSSRDLVIGAGTRVGDLARSEGIAQVASGMLTAAALAIGTHTVRNRATVGGNIVASHYPTDLPPALLALDASLSVMNVEGVREIPLHDFYTRRRDLHEKGDLIVEVRVPGENLKAAAAFEKLGRLKLDLAIVNCAVALTGLADGATRARIAVNGTGRPPTRLTDVEDLLNGKRVDGRVLEDAARLAARSVSAKSNHRASAGYRTKMTGVIVGRALSRAVGLTGQ
jgi:carbon-monoxide dehydrogenase medium subunit